METRAKAGRRSGHGVESTPASTMPEGRSRPTELGTALVIRGELRGTEDLTIDGQIEGKIVLDHYSLTIGPKGRVSAEIHARTGTVHGTVVGSITANDRIEVAPSGSVQADLYAPRIALADGSRFKGRIEMSCAQPQSAVVVRRRH
jgi:cytoskeletal protein CcmA (bactofilin family)